MTSELRFKPFAIKSMPRIEVEKMLNVLALRKRAGYSQFELSFLMGQRDFYVRDVENPKHTLDYAVPITNIFRQIFACDTQAIVPDIHRKPSYSIRILEATDESGIGIYRAEKKIKGGDWQAIATFGEEPKDCILEREAAGQAIPEEQVTDWVITGAESGYFALAKTALRILLDCEKDLGGFVRPLFLAKALKACNGTKGLPKLFKKKDVNGMFVYKG